LNILFEGRTQQEQERFNERVLIMTEALPSDKMPMLYHAADAFVLPTHGEGWGLPLMEAMASGLPTIATNWGGQTEFMNKDNSIVLGYDLVEVPDGSGHKWADPSTKELEMAMKEVVQSASSAKFEQACQEVHRKYTPNVVAVEAHELIVRLLAIVQR